ncbi:MAG: PadR family transcriptional regulator [Vicinamibacterales bacterium]
MSRESLGHFELLVLLAVLRQGDEAYGVPIAEAISESTGKQVILASVYNTLERLAEKGLVRSTIGQPTPERGGRAKRYFSITSAGLREVRAAKKALTVLWRGIPVNEG